MSRVYKASIKEVKKIKEMRLYHVYKELNEYGVNGIRERNENDTRHKHVKKAFLAKYCEKHFVDLNQ